MKYFIIITFVFFGFCPFTSGQDSTQQSDSIKSYNLEEVEIISTKYETTIKDVPLPVEISDEEEIFSISSFTPSDILNKEAGLATTRDGVWGTFASIRGLNRNNIVALIDGCRIETANDIAAGLSLIEVNDIKKIEVLKNASSSLYGSGALGGVLNIITEKGFYNDAFKLNISSISSYGSVNNNGAGTLSLNLGSKKWFINLRGTLRSADNTETPEGILKNSQFRNKNYSFFGGYKFSEQHEIKINYQNYLAEDVGIPGNSLFTPNAEVKYLSAERNLASIEYDFKNPFKYFVKLHTKIFYQEIDRVVENKPNVVTYSNNNSQRISVLRIDPYGNHKTLGGLIQSDWLFDNHFIIAGFDIWQRKLLTERERKVLIEFIDTTSQTVTNTVNKVFGEKPIPDSRYFSLGFYAQDEIAIIKDKLKFILGGRIDRIEIESEEVYNPIYEITNGAINYNPPGKKLYWSDEKADDISWSGNFSFLYSLFDDVDATFTASRSFRSPSLEERFQYIDQSGFVRIGNPDLEPEKGYFFDTGLRIWKENFSFTGNVFINFLDDLVSEVPGTFEGRPALVKTNIGKARLYGYDFSFKYAFIKNYSLSGILSYVNGEDIETNSYLPQIPPLNGRLIFSFMPVNYLRFSLGGTFFADQNKTAPMELKTPGYTVYDFQVVTTPIDLGFVKLQAAGGVDNITNKSYRNHLSAYRGLILVEPARNYYIKLKIDL